MLVPFRFLRERAKRRKEHISQEYTVENSNLSPEQIVTAQKALRILGLESKLDELNKDDVVVFLYAMGLNPTDDIIDSKLRTFKLHHKRTFTFGQLAHVWYSMLQDLTDEDEILKRAFQFFDKDGNGEISVQELRTTMHELGDLLTDEEITAFMKIMDVNNDGAIGYNEFLATLKTQAPDVGSGGSGAGPLEDAPGEEQRRRQLQLQQQQESVAGPLSATGAVPNGTVVSEPQPPNVPAGQGATAASPFAGGQAPATARPGGAGGGGPPGSRGSGTQQGDSPEPTRGSVIVRAGSASSTTQLPAFPARRQQSLKAGLVPPPLPAAAEPLLPADAAAAAPSALPRPSSGRLGQSLSMSRVPSGSGSGQQPAMERAGSQRRADDSPRGPGPGSVPGSGSGNGEGGGRDGGDQGQGLRAPSTLEPGSGSESPP